MVAMEIYTPMTMLQVQEVEAKATKNRAGDDANDLQIESVHRKEPSPPCVSTGRLALTIRARRRVKLLRKESDCEYV